MRSSVISPAASEHSVPSGADTGGSAKGHSALGLVSVPKLIKPKKLLLKKSTQ